MGLNVTYMMCRTTRTAGRGVSPSGERGGGRRRMRRRQRLAQRRGSSLPEQPEDLLRRYRPLLAVGSGAQVVGTVAKARSTCYKKLLK